MKKFLVGAMCLAMTYGLQAQLAPNSVVTATHGTVYFYQYTPPHYNNTDLFPLIISLHGVGQAGNPGELDNVLTDGLPLLVRDGSQLEFTGQGKTEGFVMLVPQTDRGNVLDWPTFYVDEMIDYGINHLRVDPERIFLTGFSTGGGGVWKYATSSAVAASKLAGIIPAASAVTPDIIPQAGYCNIAASKVAVWGFHGGDDHEFPYQADAIDAAAVNNCSPIIPAVDTIIAGEGHGIFQTVVYDLTNSHHIPNIFQWMLKVNRGMNVTTNSPPVPVIAAGPIVGGNLVIPLTAPVKGFTLDGSASHDDDDIIMNYLWQKTDIPAGLTPEDTIVVASAMWPSTTVAASPAHLRIPAGDWNFKFRVQDYLTSAIYGSNNHTQIVNVTVRISYPDGSHAAPATDAGGSVIIPSDQTQVLGRVGQAEAYNCTDCNIVSYLWTQLSGPAATLSNYHDPSQPYPPGESAVAFTGLNSPGVYQFQFSATNNHGDTGADIFTITKLGALPVNYSWFNGQNQDGKNVLSWATTSEVNSARFDVLRSVDGINFMAVGSVTAKGGTGLTTYTFDDNNATRGLTYYRLSQVDKDGKSTLSKIISINNRKTGLYIEKYPNPVHDNLTVNIQGITNGAMHIIIADMQGKAIIQQLWQKDQPLLKKVVNVGILQNGVYQMIVTVGQDKQVSSFVKY